MKLRNEKNMSFTLSNRLFSRVIDSIVYSWINIDIWRPLFKKYKIIDKKLIEQLKWFALPVLEDGFWDALLVALDLQE